MQACYDRWNAVVTTDKVDIVVVIPHVGFKVVIQYLWLVLMISPNISYCWKNDFNTAALDLLQFCIICFICVMLIG